MNYIQHRILTVVLLLAALLLLPVSLMSQYISEGGAQFGNYHFEDWGFFDENDTMSYEPAYWHAWGTAYGEYNVLMNAKYQQIWPSDKLRPGSTFGTHSAKITARDVLGLITANGGVTNGRIHVGSTTASDSSNFNITLRENASFNTPLGMFPDSLTLWMAFVCEYPNQQGRVRAIVHGDCNFAERADGTFNRNDMYCGQALNSFARTNDINDTVNLHWQRVSIPFVYDGQCQNPAYVLFTLGTNRYPGQGAGNEYILVDDILMIYNPTLKFGDFNLSRIVNDGDDFYFDIPFSLTGTMSPSNLNQENNIVTAQLSDSAGNFDNPYMLGSVQTDVSGVIHAVAHNDIAYGSKYRIRLVSTNYPMISEDNGYDIVVDSLEGITESDMQLRIFPTIVNDYVIVESESMIKNIHVYDVSGRCVKTLENMSEQRVEVNMKDVTSGVYVFMIDTGRKKISKKVVKKIH